MIKRTIGILVISTLLTGCSVSSADNGEKREDISLHTEMSSTISSEYPDYPEEYVKAEGNVTFNCDVVTGEYSAEQRVYTAAANLRPIHTDQAYDELYSRITDFDIYEYDEKNEYGEMVKTATYVDKNETTFSFGPLSSQLSYMQRSRMPYILSAFRLDDTADDYNADLYSTQEQLPFSDREEVYASLIQLLERINAGNEYQYKAYAMDHLTLKSEERHEDMDGNIDKARYKTDWSSADDSYYLVMRQYFEALPVYHVYAELFREAADMNTPVQAVVSADGIESLNIERIFSFSDRKEVETLLAFDDIAKTVADKYNQSADAGTCDIERAELYYYVDIIGGTGTYAVFPCWILTGTENTKSVGSKVQIIINAQTGEEIK